MRVLLIEDDERLAGVLSEGLSERGMEVSVAGSFEEGWERAVLGSHDVIVLDVMLPDGSGIDLCASLREHDVEAPVLMLTALDDVEDRVRGLEAGADDYLAKPFAFPELVARVRALARRPPGIAPEERRFADLVVDLRSRRVARAGRTIRLTNKEWDLLELFARNPDRVIDRAEIGAYVWDENHDPFTNVIEVLVRRLRTKIDEGFEPRLIHTVRGAGYRFGP